MPYIWTYFKVGFLQVPLTCNAQHIGGVYGSQKSLHLNLTHFWDIDRLGITGRKDLLQVEKEYA